ncbi:MAG: sodium ion-translocating decarboxylase subunit beta [Clostridia bacterium]|nr:sodium ion-translocating decarboxylase subunit beta [Clostridia bacterium]
MLDVIIQFLNDTGFAAFASDPLKIVMLLISFVLMYLAIVKKFEPLLLLPIAFGMLLSNLPFAEMYHSELFAGGHVNWGMFGGATVVDTANFNYSFFTEGLAVLNSGDVYGGGAVLGHLTDVTVDGSGFIDTLGRVLTEDGTVIAQAGKVVVSLDMTYLDGANLMYQGMSAPLATGAYTVSAGLLDFLYLGVKLNIYPCLIFLGVGAMTDFGPLIANPKSLLLGAAAQLGIFTTYIGARLLNATGILEFSQKQAGSIGIIGGADGPTSIFTASQLAPELLAPIAVAAYSYMALVPVIQPPIMKLLTTKKERTIKMQQLREVSKTEKIIFPIVITVFVSLLLPSAAPLVGCLMLGNLFKECGVVDRLSKTVQNELMNIVTIFLGVTVGATATASSFLNLQTLGIMLLGIIAFSFGTAGGVLLAKFMNLFTKNKINPLIGSAGVSAVPMAARVSQVVGQKEDPSNFLLMHAMGPNVAGVIGSAIAAGMMITLLG